MNALLLIDALEPCEQEQLRCRVGNGTIMLLVLGRECRFSKRTVLEHCMGILIRITCLLEIPDYRRAMKLLIMPIPPTDIRTVHMFTCNDLTVEGR